MANSSLIAFAGTLGALALGVIGPTPALGHPETPASDGVRAAAPAPDDDIPAPPPTFQAGGVTVDERVGGRIPLDAAFRTQDGTKTTLRELFRGGLPVVLTFNYSDCPMLCSVMLDGVVDVLAQIAPFAAGEQFRIITIIIEPKEAPQRAADTRMKYLSKLQRKKDDLRKPAQEGGWTFLVAAEDGDDSSIQSLADAVGVRFHKASTGDWAHPAVLVFLSPSGAVTRYVHGARFEPDDISTSIVRAGISEPSGAIGFVNRCFHYDPGAHSYARTGLNVMKFTAAVFATMVAGALVLAHLLRRSGRKGVART
jgi:protein SCO1/2